MYAFEQDVPINAAVYARIIDGSVPMFLKASWRIWLSSVRTGTSTTWTCGRPRLTTTRDSRTRFVPK